MQGGVSGGKASLWLNGVDEFSLLNCDRSIVKFTCVELKGDNDAILRYYWRQQNKWSFNKFALVVGVAEEIKKKDKEENLHRIRNFVM